MKIEDREVSENEEGGEVPETEEGKVSEESEGDQATPKRPRRMGEPPARAKWHPLSTIPKVPKFEVKRKDEKGQRRRIGWTRRAYNRSVILSLTSPSSEQKSHPPQEVQGSR